MHSICAFSHVFAVYTPVIAEDNLTETVSRPIHAFGLLFAVSTHGYRDHVTEILPKPTYVFLAHTQTYTHLSRVKGDNDVFAGSRTRTSIDV